MVQTIDTILARYADDGIVVRELHDVPPYRVYEVRLEGRRAVLKIDDHLWENPHVFDGASTPVLCHGDVHPDHLAHTDGEATAAIDFEHALVAPAAYDYWRTVQPYIEAPDDVSDAVACAFRDGYESVRPLPDGLERRRLAYRLLNLVAFLESLHLQRAADQRWREQLGERLRTAAFETLETLRGNDSNN